MKRKMVIMAALIGCLSFQSTQAQGFLGKLKDKATGKSNSSSGNKETEKDSLAQDLEKITIKQDRNNIGGIYYFQKPLIHEGNDSGFGPKKTMFKKVLIEADADKGWIWMRTRKWEEGLFGKLLFSMGDESWVKDLAKANIISGLNGSSSQENMRYHYLDLMKMNSGEKAAWQPFQMDRVQLTWLEPGVLVLHTSTTLAKSLKACEGPSFINTEFYGEQQFNLVYKAGADISKWTPEKIKQRIFEQALKRCEFFLADAIAKNVMPNKVTGSKDEPSNAAILKAAQERATHYKYAETIDYVYPTSAWVNRYENIWNGNVVLRTLTNRRMNFVVVYKKVNGKCYYEEMTLEQPNTYTAGTIDEKFAGNGVFVSGNMGIRAVDCAKVKK